MAYWEEVGGEFGEYCDGEYCDGGYSTGYMGGGGGPVCGSIVSVLRAATKETYKYQECLLKLNFHSHHRT